LRRPSSFSASKYNVELKDIAATIRDHLGGDAAKVPTQVLPDDVVRAAAESNPQFRAMVPDLGYAKQTSNERARNVLGWTPRDPAEAITSAAETMVKEGLVSA
jgi:nucleoside-diphosphate-sugar epimerase